MNNEEAPAAAVDTAIPQASNKNGSALNAVRDRKLSVVSKQYDMDGDGELNEAEQASKLLFFLWLLSYYCMHMMLYHGRLLSGRS